MPSAFRFCLVLIVTLFVFAGGVHATVLTFDDIPSPISQMAVPNGYGGFSWSQVNILHKNVAASGSGYKNGLVSGDWVAYNNFDNLAVTSGAMFDFTGAWFTSAWDDANTLVVKGYVGTVEQFSASVGIVKAQATWIQLDFMGIDKLTLDTTGTQFVMDNFTINESAPVPEPSTLILLGAGIAGLVWSRNKRS